MHAIIDRCAAFWVPHLLMPDSLMHFNNIAVPLITFTLPYSPYSNGAVYGLEQQNASNVYCNRLRATNARGIVAGSLACRSKCTLHLISFPHRRKGTSN